MSGLGTNRDRDKGRKWELGAAKKKKKKRKDLYPTRQGYLRMSQQRDLPESMAWRVIGRLEPGQTQRSVADAVGVARSVVARLWNRF
ncbi:hypothetical protein TNCV_5128251 [Trichonephila clavipes]|nr:hypothetical protein TNCV_5128251 [Trichonephila clavipes]